MFTVSFIHKKLKSLKSFENTWRPVDSKTHVLYMHTSNTCGGWCTVAGAGCEWIVKGIFQLLSMDSTQVQAFLLILDLALHLPHYPLFSLVPSHPLTVRQVIIFKNLGLNSHRVIAYKAQWAKRRSAPG